MRFLPNLSFIRFLGMEMLWMQNMQVNPPILRMTNSLPIYIVLIFWCPKLQYLILLEPQSCHSPHIWPSPSTNDEVVPSTTIVFFLKKHIDASNGYPFVLSNIMSTYKKNSPNSTGDASSCALFLKSRISDLPKYATCITSSRQRYEFPKVTSC